MNYNFEWDANKAKSNINKHDVSFEDSASVFRDKNMISLFDDEHSESEDRWITIGMNLYTKTLVVVHTYVSVDNENCNIRIISARRATKKEQQIYLEELR
jgi:uncharacterized DUF497 family protein